MPVAAGTHGRVRDSSYQEEMKRQVKECIECGDRTVHWCPRCQRYVCHRCKTLHKAKCAPAPSLT
jgi:hypothetical protein